MSLSGKSLPTFPTRFFKGPPFIVRIFRCHGTGIGASGKSCWSPPYPCRSWQGKPLPTKAIGCPLCRCFFDSWYLGGTSFACKGCGKKAILGSIVVEDKNIECQ